LDKVETENGGKASGIIVPDHVVPDVKAPQEPI